MQGASEWEVGVIYLETYVLPHERMAYNEIDLYELYYDKPYQLSMSRVVVYELPPA